MRIAVTHENEETFRHFGHAEKSEVYDAVYGKVVRTAVVDTKGGGHGALAGLLEGICENVLICSGSCH